MKKYFGLLICLFVLNACDDGEMTFESFDFSEVTTSNFCSDNNLLTKINNNEALIIQVNSTTINDIFPYKSVIGTRIIPLNSSNKIIYRTFSGTVTADYFCSSIPPVTPTVSSEYTTTDESNGQIEITTTLIPGTTTLAAAKYIHSIVFRDITFRNEQGQTITYETLNFGTYQTSSNVSFTPSFSALPVQSCTAGNFFKIRDTNVANDADKENLNRVLEINIPIDQFPVLANDPKTVFIGQNGVSATYRVYNGDITKEEYCSEATTLNKYEEWQAAEGVDSTSNNDDDTGYFIIDATADLSGNLVYTINMYKITYNRAFPIDPTPGAVIGKFTTTTDTFGSFTLPVQ